VAGVALFAEGSAVPVVQGVAGSAGGGGFLVLIAGVAGGAGHLAMFALQGEPGFLVMVEAAFAPRDLVVAFLAIFPQPSLVPVVGLVAGMAGVGRVTELFSGLVAVRTAGSRVRTLEGEVGRGMVERFRVQVQNVGFPADMFLVAGLALALAQAFCFPVKAEFSGQVLGNILVAVQALAVLAFLLEQIVALGALVLVLGVALDHRTGHHEPFQ